MYLAGQTWLLPLHQGMFETCLCDYSKVARTLHVCPVYGLHFHVVPHQHSLLDFLEQSSDCAEENFVTAACWLCSRAAV